LPINLGEVEDQCFQLFEPEGRVLKAPGASLRFIKKRFRQIVCNFEFYTGCHKYVPIDQRLNFRAHRGYNLKRSTARCAKIKELDLAALGTQTASIFIPLSAGLRQERLIKCPQID